MPPLYVVEQGARLHQEGRRLVVKKDDVELSSAPLVQVSEVVLMGNVGLTTPVIKLLLGENLDVVFLTEDGNYCGRLTGPATPHVLLRRKQYAAQSAAGLSLKMGQQFVRGKLLNERALLMRHNRERGDEVVGQAVDALAEAIQRTERTTVLNALLGVEGAATAAYFSAWKRLLKPEWKFEKRMRRPPPDPINVLLSFGYTLLTRTAWSAVEAAGLDPYAGFLHVVDYNRPSLALDLMEEFRAVVDGVILWCVNSGQVTPEDFAPGDAERLARDYPPGTLSAEGDRARPVVMNAQAKRAFISAYERRMADQILHPPSAERLSVRRCIMAQAREIVRCIQKGEPDYAAMHFR